MSTNTTELSVDFVLSESGYALNFILFTFIGLCIVLSDNILYYIGMYYYEGSMKYRNKNFSRLSGLISVFMFRLKKLQKKSNKCCNNNPSFKMPKDYVCQPFFLKALHHFMLYFVVYYITFRYALPTD